jgi:hypothetical protein
MSIMGYWESLIKRDGWPWHRASIGPKPWRGDPSNPVVGHCPTCGRELRRMMMVVCSDADCPTGLNGRIRL